MPLTPEEQVSVRHHCGYLNVSEASTFVLGNPASIETQFIIEGAMTRVMEHALPRLRKTLAILDSIEQQMVDDHELLAVTSLGEISINPEEHKRLVAQYDYWVDALCNILGVIRNPFDRRLGRNSINVRVAE